MTRTLRALVIASLCVAIPARGVVHAQAPAACGPGGGKLALVLSGGGAKGFAHLAVLRMLDSLGIVPDLVVGTSAGAMIGALYASGLDEPEILKQFRALGLDSLVGRYGAATPPSLGDRRAILAWEGGRQGYTLQTSVVREAPLNALMSALYIRGNLQARGDFDRLPIPFRAVAADLRTRQQVILGSGDLALAVRASSSIPIVFRTVAVNGRDLVDGGIANNIPVDVARSLGATSIIVSTLLDSALAKMRSDDPIAVAAQMVNLLFEQTVPPVKPGELVLQSDVTGINQLDFSGETIAQALAAGEVAARALVADRCLARGRARPRGRVPPLAAAITTPGTDPDVARVLRLTLDGLGGAAVDLPQLQERLRRLSRVQRYRSIWLTPVKGPGDSVLFAAAARPSSIERQLAGAAFDRELGGRIWVGRIKRYDRRNAEATEVVEIGQLEQQGTFTLRRSYDVLRSPWSPLLNATVTRTRVRVINDGIEAPAIKTADWLVELGVERQFSRRASFSLTAFARQWDEPVFRGTPTAPGARLRFELLGVSSAPRGVVEFEGTTRYWRTSAELRFPRSWRGFTVQPTFSAVIAAHTPLQNSAYLGGSDAGFPGFMIQELRGSQAAMASVQLSHSIYGPLRLQGLVAGGALQQGEVKLFGTARGYFGARGGLGVTTALGPVALEYGVNDRGRNNIWLRFGDWF